MLVEIFPNFFFLKNFVLEICFRRKKFQKRFFQKKFETNFSQKNFWIFFEKKTFFEKQFLKFFFEKLIFEKKFRKKINLNPFQPILPKQNLLHPISTHFNPLYSFTTSYSSPKKTDPTCYNQILGSWLE